MKCFRHYQYACAQLIEYTHELAFRTGPFTEPRRANTDCPTIVLEIYAYAIRTL